MSLEECSSLVKQVSSLQDVDLSVEFLVDLQNFIYENIVLKEATYKDFQKKMNSLWLPFFSQCSHHLCERALVYSYKNLKEESNHQVILFETLAYILHVIDYFRLKLEFSGLNCQKIIFNFVNKVNISSPTSFSGKSKSDPKKEQKCREYLEISNIILLINALLKSLQVYRDYVAERKQLEESSCLEPFSINMSSDNKKKKSAKNKCSQTQKERPSMTLEIQRLAANLDKKFDSGELIQLVSGTLCHRMKYLFSLAENMKSEISINEICNELMTCCKSWVEHFRRKKSDENFRRLVVKACGSLIRYLTDAEDCPNDWEYSVELLITMKCYLLESLSDAKELINFLVSLKTCLDVICKAKKSDIESLCNMVFRKFVSIAKRDTSGFSSSNANMTLRVSNFLTKLRFFEHSRNALKIFWKFVDAEKATLSGKLYSSGICLCIGETSLREKFFCIKDGDDNVESLDAHITKYGKYAIELLTELSSEKDNFFKDLDIGKISKEEAIDCLSECISRWVDDLPELVESHKSDVKFSSIKINKKFFLFATTALESLFIISRNRFDHSIMCLFFKCIDSCLQIGYLSDAFALSTCLFESLSVDDNIDDVGQKNIERLGKIFYDNACIGYRNRNFDDAYWLFSKSCIYYNAWCGNSNERIGSCKLKKRYTSMVSCGRKITNWEQFEKSLPESLCHCDLTVLADVVKPLVEMFVNKRLLEHSNLKKKRDSYFFHTLFPDADYQRLSIFIKAEMDTYRIFSKSKEHKNFVVDLNHVDCLDSILSFCNEKMKSKVENTDYQCYARLRAEILIEKAQILDYSPQLSTSCPVSLCSEAIQLLQTGKLENSTRDKKRPSTILDQLATAHLWLAISLRKQYTQHENDLLSKQQQQQKEQQLQTQTEDPNTKPIITDEIYEENDSSYDEIGTDFYDEDEVIVVKKKSAQKKKTVSDGRHQIFNISHGGVSESDGKSDDEKGREQEMKTTTTGTKARKKHNSNSNSNSNNYHNNHGIGNGNGMNNNNNNDNNDNNEYGQKRKETRSKGKKNVNVTGNITFKKQTTFFENMFDENLFCALANCLDLWSNIIGHQLSYSPSSSSASSFSCSNGSFASGCACPFWCSDDDKNAKKKRQTATKNKKTVEKKNSLLEWLENYESKNINEDSLGLWFSNLDETFARLNLLCNICRFSYDIYYEGALKLLIVFCDLMALRQDSRRTYWIKEKCGALISLTNLYFELQRKELAESFRSHISHNLLDKLDEDENLLSEFSMLAIKRDFLYSDVFASTTNIDEACKQQIKIHSDNFKTIPKNGRTWAEIFLCTGNITDAMKNYTEAVKNYVKCMGNLKDFNLDFYFEFTTTLLSFSGLFVLRGLPKEARYYLQKAYEICKRHTITSKMLDVLVRLFELEFQMGIEEGKEKYRHEMLVIKNVYQSTSLAMNKLKFRCFRFQDSEIVAMLLSLLKINEAHVEVMGNRNNAAVTFFNEAEKITSNFDGRLTENMKHLIASEKNWISFLLNETQDRKVYNEHKNDSDVENKTSNVKRKEKKSKEFKGTKKSHGSDIISCECKNRYLEKMNLPIRDNVHSPSFWKLWEARRYYHCARIILSQKTHATSFNGFVLNQCEDEEMKSKGRSYLKKSIEICRKFPASLLLNEVLKCLAQTYEDDPLKFALYLHESISPLARSEMKRLEDVKAGTMKGKERQTQKQKNAASLFSVSQPLSLVQFEKDYKSKLPAHWVSVLITFDYSSRCLLLSRLQKDGDPFNLCLNLFDHDKGDLYDQIMTEFNDILSEMHTGMTEKKVSQQDWWLKRFALDNRLKCTLEKIQDDWLGCWKGILLGKVDTPEDSLEKLVEGLQPKISQIIGHSVTISKQLCSFILETSCDCKSDIECILEKCVDADVTKLQIAKLASLFIKELGTIVKSNRREHTIFILDKSVQNLPWESMPYIKHYPMSRMPSLSFVIERCNTRSDVILNGIDVNDAYYVVNPSDDLKNTEKVFAPDFKRRNWNGTVNTMPKEDEIQTALTEKDLYVYCGHGGGEKYMKGDKIKQIDCKAVALIFGCSSGKLKSYGNFEPSGTALNYIYSSCPAVLGILWDVTDVDIDRFGHQLVQSWLDDGYSLVEATSKARKACKLKWIVGAAPVVYGVPIYRSSRSNS